MHLSQVTPWGWFWLAWLNVGFDVEIYWLAVNAANTFSRQIWGFERLDMSHPLEFAEWTPYHWGLAITLWLFFAWLSVHFPFGWIR